jgi:hypothetical protein
MKTMSNGKTRPMESKSFILAGIVLMSRQFSRWQNGSQHSYKSSVESHKLLLVFQLALGIEQPPRRDWRQNGARYLEERPCCAEIAREIDLFSRRTL